MRRLEPDLVLMDVRMPQMDGLEATRQIKADHPEVSVLIITTYENPDYLLEAIKAGAAGYVLKDAPNRQLLNAMRRALQGESPINQELATQLIRAPGRRSPPSLQLLVLRRLPKHMRAPHLKARRLLLEELTPREEEVLGLVAQGKTNQEIARSLSISRATAKVHVRHIIAKLGVSDRTQAAVRALGLGLAPYPKKTGP